MSKRTLGILGFALAVFGAAAYMKLSGIAGELTAAASAGAWFPLVVAAAALVDSVNPCAFSVLLITIGFLLSLGRDRWSILAVGGVYIAGLFTVYVAIGLGILRALTLFGVPHGASRIGAVVIILAGILDILGELFPKFPIRLVIPAAAKPTIARLMGRATYPAAFGLGVAVGLFEFPCTGGPYLFVLGLLHDQASFWAGLGYLGLYNLIFVSPLIAILLAATTKELLAQIDAWRKTSVGGVRFGSGLAMVALGLIILAF